MELNFCRRCGEPLSAVDHGGYRCVNDHTVFANAAPTVGIFFINSEDKLLLAVRGIEPNKGCLDCIGGFVDAGETFEQALEREISEETGLTPADYSRPIYLTSAVSGYQYQAEDRQVLSCIFMATLQDGAVPTARDDVAELVWLDPSEVDIERFGDAQDVRAGFRQLLEVVS